MGLGRFNPCPLRIGGGKRSIELAHESLLGAYRPVLDVAPEQLAESEAYAEAAVLAMVWASGRRAANQAIPTRMLEWVEEYEQIVLTHPGTYDSDHQRRAEIAAKFRSLVANAEGDIYEACSLILGINIEDVTYLDDSEATTYLPGINPGPPGIEWMSQRAIARVEVNSASLTEAEYTRKVEKLVALLDALLPAWMGFDVFRLDNDGAEDGFFLDVSLLDEVGL